MLLASTYKVVAYGNGLPNPALVHDYAMLKAAETAREAGGTHFVVTRGHDASSVAYAAPVLLSFPGKEIEIRVLTVRPGQAVPRGACSAGEVIGSLSHRKGASQ